MRCIARQDYHLGDLAQCPSHMMIEPCPQAALEKASQLRNYDFAFIKRSNESWTYAILAHRHLANFDSSEEHMVFVMNKRGSTKIIKKKHWASYVRCVARED
jgi:negative regulator of sigma E activity